MPTQKLPAYFERYLDQKFGETIDSINELKTHVNEEIQLIRKAIEALEKKTAQLTWAIIILFIILLVHDIAKVSILDILMKLFGGV